MAAKNKLIIRNKEEYKNWQQLYKNSLYNSMYNHISVQHETYLVKVIFY